MLSSSRALDSPALELLCELEDAALSIGRSLEATVTAAGRLQLGPREILTPERVTRISTHRDALRVLVLVCDTVVQNRLASFRQQLRDYRGAAVQPALRLSTVNGYGGCVACGDATDAPTWCWRCQLAGRLATHGDVPAGWVPVSGRAVAAA